jgi:hypothetical protein
VRTGYPGGGAIMAAVAEESDLGLPMYYVGEEEEDPKAAAAKAEREKRKEGGRWGLDKIREKDLERIKEEQARHAATLPPRRRLDPQAESPAGPMRHLSVTRGGPQLASSANVISVRVSESPVGYPLLVHGAIFVRDELDCKRVYVFRRDPNNCQTITSEVVISANCVHIGCCCKCRLIQSAFFN